MGSYSWPHHPREERRPGVGHFGSPFFLLQLPLVRCYSPFFFSCSLSSFAVAVDSSQKSIEFKTLPWKSKRRTRRAIRGHNFLLVPRNDIFRCYVVAGILRIILIQIGGRTSAKSKIICLEQVFPTSFQPTKL